MKYPHLSRRQFLKSVTLAAATLAAPPSLLDAAEPPLAVASEDQDASVAAIKQPVFKPMASASVFGAITDISMGWDGTVWGIDGGGAPHLYDPLQDAWQPFGQGIDAATTTLNTTTFSRTIYLFRGQEYCAYATPPNSTFSTGTIAANWPNVPDSFKLGLTGATTVNSQLIFIKGGLYVPADGSAPAAKLSAMTNWPATAPWADGLIDSVYTRIDDNNIATCFLLRGDAYITADFQTKTITQGPQPTSAILPNNLAGQGIDAATNTNGENEIFFQGCSYVVVIGFVKLQPRYIGVGFEFQTPPTWFPQLNHAPSGRAGALWAATTTSAILQHDGEQWLVTPGAGSSVSAGQDGSTFVVGTDSNLYRWNGASYDPLGSPAPLAQVSIGDANHVWVRDTGNGVHRYASSAFAPVNLGAGVPAPTHIGANADGTLWHCTGSNPNAYRFISEAAVPSQAITVVGGGVVTGVSKVATTGFGQAYCIASQGSGAQLYRYDSPYLFKTANQYSLFSRDVIAYGLGLLYLVAQTDLNVPMQPILSRLVALDAHTGAEVASTLTLPNGWSYSEVTFDPQLDLVYVGTAPADAGDGQSQAQLLALNARTLQTVWSYNVTAAAPATTVKGIDAAPGLSGSLLCFGDRSGTLYLIDTQQALAQTQQGQPVQETALWQVSFTVFGPGPYSAVRMPTPVIVNNRVYGVIHNVVSTTLQTATYTRNADGPLFEQTNGLPDVTGIDQPVLLTAARRAPVVVTGYTPAAPETPMLAVHRSQSVWVVDPSDTVASQSFTLPASSFITSGLAFDDGVRAGQPLTTTPSPSGLRLWFGDSQGNLWGLGVSANGQWTPQDHTPFQAVPVMAIYTTPVVYKDPSGGATVLYGIFNPIPVNPNAPQTFLYGYDPDNGNVASLATGQTSITALSHSAPNGVAYAGGVDSSNYASAPTAASIPQVFGIRIDSLTQGLRDFVVDNQMMQDPDPNAPGGDTTDANNPIPPSRPRYQSHVTVLDSDPNNPGATSPLPFEPVKIWADQPTTVAVDGVSYAIGPGDSQYALVRTGGDGALVITSGYVTTAATDAPDLYAASLRLWANFMNPYERIVVHPDYEFHTRISQAQANPSDDNPDTPNLVTTKSYAATTKTPTPAPLFSPGEISAGQPQNCANAISQMRSGVGFGGSANSARAQFPRNMLFVGGRKSAQRALRRSGGALDSAAQTTQKYVAYADVPGMGYLPNNGQLTRPVTAVQPTGLQFTKPQGQPTTSAALAITSSADAQLAIDALPPPTVNPPWQSPSAQAQGASGGSAIQRADNIFADFWNWLKKEVEAAVVEITHVIVSVADDVTVGIRLLVNGVEQVFKAVVRVLDDIASAIGALFSMLLKYVEDVIAVMSVIFQFGQIIQTHTALKTELLSRINAISTAVAAQVRSNVDTIFNQGEAAITGFLNQLRPQFQNQAIQQQPKMGSTAHTALTVNAPAGPSNQAVPGMWAAQKLKTGLGSATTPSTQPAPPGDDPLSDFLDGFVASLSGNGALAAVFNQLRSDLGQLISPRSAKQFLATLMDTLIDIVEALLVGALAIGQALVDGLLDALPSVLQDLFGAGGLLVAPLDIPVLSWLYQTLFGAPLSFVDVVVLVAAIPVTIVYRVAFGVWPADDNSSVLVVPNPGIGATTVQMPNFSVKALARALTLFSGIATLVHGIVALFVDIEPKPPATLQKVSVAIGLLNTASTFPVSDIVTANSYDIAEFGLRACNTMLTVIRLKQFENPATQAFMSVFLPALGAGLNFDLLVVSIVGVATKNQSVGFSFAARIIDTFPGIVKPAKLGGEEGRLVAGAVDLIAGLAGGVLKIVSALPSGGVSPQTRWYLPWVPVRRP
jgi:hypothetical protein